MKRSPRESNPSATVDGPLQKALIHHHAGELGHAETLYRQILQDSPGHPHASHLLGVIMYQTGKYAIALGLIDQALLLMPDFADAHCNRGLTLQQLQQYQQAVESFDRAILLKPGYADAYNSRGLALQQLQQYQQAIESFDQAIKLRPGYADAYNNRGTVFHELHQYQPALESFDQALLLKPDDALAHNNRGGALDGLQQYQQALESFDRCLVLTPGCSTAHNGRGTVLQRLQQYRAALESFDQAILLQPQDAVAWNGRGGAFIAMRQYQQALDSYDQALRLSPHFARAYDNRGHALLGLRQYQQALESFDQALLLHPNSPEACNGRGAALLGLEQYQAAVQSWDKAIELNPDYAEAHGNRGVAFFGLRQYPQALESLDRALVLKPDCDNLRGMRLHVRQLMADWDDIERQCRDLEARIDLNQKVTPPLPILAISGIPASQRKAAEIFVRDKHPSCPEIIPRRPKRNRIRVGYFSADFHHHAISYLMAELFERHDRSKFELLGFSFGPDHDELSIRIAAAMDQFVDVRLLSDREAVRLSRELEVDIAVDLMGYTQHARTEIFAQRAAPVQINYLGYPATMGADFIDYIIADHVLIPEANRKHYSEKIAYLPDSFQANDSTWILSTKPYTRAGEGLPERGFVYCCFNNNYKITPAVFDIWMRILERVEGSVLWLLQTNPWAAGNLRGQAVRRGIPAERLIFSPPLPICDHMARLPLAGLFLDTLPFNAGATASPVLWAGLPLLTCMGETLASRMGASLLCAIGMPELVTNTPADYEALAVELALDPERYHQIREKLRRNRTTAPLFDIPTFARHLEAAYTAMYERYQADLLPEHIYVARLPSSPGFLTPLSS